MGFDLHLVKDGLKRAGDGIKPGRELRGIFINIGDMLARHARIHGGLGHGDRNSRDEPRIEGNRNQIFRAKVQARAMIGGGHLIGNILARQACEGLGGGDLHFLVDGAGPHIEGAAEYVGEAQDIVHLVGIVGAAGRHDGVAT